MSTDDNIGNMNLFSILIKRSTIEMMKLFIILGALNTMMAVGTGAFGAHGLENKLSENTCPSGKKRQCTKCIMV